MPADLARQLPRFAEVLDREAPAISIDEIRSRSTVSVDVDLPEPLVWVELMSVNGGAEVAPPRTEKIGDRDAPIELAPTVGGRSSHRRRLALTALLPLRRRSWWSPWRPRSRSTTNPAPLICRHPRSPVRRFAGTHGADGAPTDGPQLAARHGGGPGR